MFDDDEIAAYEQQLEDTSLKALLIQQNALLHSILQELQQDVVDASDSDDRLVCDMCGESYPRDELVTHAIESHKAPSDISIEAVARGE